MNKGYRGSAHDWIGKDICNLHDEKLGELADIVFATADARIIYGVLSVGGVLGMGEKLFAVPWDALQVESDGDKQLRFRLDASPERLKTATGIDKDNWPDDPDMGFIERTHTNYT